MPFTRRERYRLDSGPSDHLVGATVRVLRRKSYEDGDGAAVLGISLVNSCSLHDSLYFAVLEGREFHG